MVVTGLSVAFLLVQVYNRGILEVLWQNLFLPYEGEQLSQPIDKNISATFVNFCRYAVSARGLTI